MLNDANITADTPVTKDLKGITLKSALHLMLKDLGDLTYIIQDEVLLITTQEQADANLVLKVYPVADLVLSANSLRNSAMQGMGGGGMGMMGAAAAWVAAWVAVWAGVWAAAAEAAAWAAGECSMSPD